MQNIDVILGMDWLPSNHVVMNCSAKTFFITKQLMSIDSSLSNSFAINVSCHKCIVKGA